MQMQQQQMPKNMPPVPPSDSALSWQQGGGQPQPPSAVSVVTTVWNVTNTTQTGPYNQPPNGPGFTNTTMSAGFTNTTMAPSSSPYSQQQQSFPGNPVQKPPYTHNPYNRSNSYNRNTEFYSGYPPTPTTPTNPPTGGPPPEAALSAAAMVAAAATATATATATAMMGVHQDQRQQPNMPINVNMPNHYPQMNPQPQQYNNQYAPMQRPQGPHMQGMNMAMNQPGMTPGPGMGMPGPGPGPMMAKRMPSYREMTRNAPYPNPPFIRDKRFPVSGQQVPAEPQYGMPPAQQYQMGMQPGQYGASKPGYPPQQPLPSPTYGQQPRPQAPPPGSNGYPPNMFMNPNAPYGAQRGMVPNPGYNPHPGQHPGQHPQQQHLPQPQQHPHPHPQQQQFNPQQQVPQGYTQNQIFPHSPIHGNPTPPITPGPHVPTYPGGPDIKPNMADIKPHIPKRENDELRLTFPVRDGVVLPPFRLEHNLAVSNHVFHLRESVYQTLMWRSDLELQLKCFHHEDRQMNTNWPASVTVSVNATPLNIERGENKTSHKPLYLKDVCQPGRNTIQITVTACCCSHLFVLQLVHRPSVRSVLQGLLRKRLLPAEHCITKIKRNFTSVAANSNPLNGGEDGVEQTAIKVSLKCPITFRRISLPARGHDCKHIQCFDLESYLQLNCERGSWRCPVCNKTALLEGLEIDQYIWGILNSLANTEFEEVTIDQTASWKPIPVKVMKEEENGPCSNNNASVAAAANERWLKAMSPSSMKMPTMSTWDGFYGQQMSPMPPSSQGGGPNNMYQNNFEHANGQNRPPSSNFQSAATDFLTPLSQMSDNLANDSQQINLNHNSPAAPMNHPHNSPAALNHPHTPLDGSSQPLRHPTPGTPCSTSAPGPVPHSSMPQNCNSSQPLSHSGPMPTSTPSSSTGSITTSSAINNTPTSNCNSVDSSANNNNQLPHHNDLSSDLPFDPAAIIDGQGQEGLDLLPNNLDDPMELLSLLGPDTGGNSNNNGNTSGNSDDLLSLFDP